MASLGVWYWSAGSVSVNTVATPKIEMFYWVAILFSQTLGTALGDWMADTNGLGYEGGALVFAAGLAVIVGAYFYTNVSRTLLFWSCVHPDAAARGDARRPARQAAGRGRARVRPILCVRHSRGRHRGLHFLPQRAGKHPGAQQQST